jgi:signal transduction histidine kinase
MAVVSLLLFVAGSNPLPAVFALYSTVSHSKRPLRFGVVASVALVGTFIGGMLIHHEGGVSLIATGVGSVLLVSGAFGFALYSSVRSNYVRALGQRAKMIERESALIARSARDEERLRIARELHDVVAHHITLVSVFTEALKSTGGASSARGDEIIDTIGQEARSALGELREIVGVVHDDVSDAREADDLLRPQPRLADLPQLREVLETAGVSTAFTILGRPHSLSRAVELALYRIAQEAVTNIVKHAEAAHATIVLAFDHDTVSLSIDDDGKGVAAGPLEGFGLSGMRERAALLGGHCDVGATETGFRVHVALPSAADDVRYDAPVERTLR